MAPPNLPKSGGVFLVKKLRVSLFSRKTYICTVFIFISALRQRLLSWIPICIHTQTQSNQSSEVVTSCVCSMLNLTLISQLLEDIRSIFLYVQHIAKHDPLQLLELLPLMSSLVHPAAMDPVQNSQQTCSKHQNVDQPETSGGAVARCFIKVAGKSCVANQSTPTRTSES